MAKTTTPSAADELAAPVPVPELLKFSDLVYTSRTLIIPPSNRTLSVAKGLAEVSPADAEAVSFLKAYADFKPLKE
jgi:hypothetical protein